MTDQYSNPNITTVAVMIATLTVTNNTIMCISYAIFF
ncbi:unnamed protein product [Brassica rapa subsp. trilocularis]